MIDTAAKCGCPSGRTPRFLQPCILLLLKKKKSYGYEIIENLSKGCFLETQPDAGAVYRILRKLEKDEFVKSTWDTEDKRPAKRIYKITTDGNKLLDQWAKSIMEKRDSLNIFLSNYDKIK